MTSVVVGAVTILSAGLVSGILLGDFVGVSAVRPSLPASCFVQVQQGIHVRFVPMMPLLMATVIVAGGVSAFLSRRSSRAASVLFLLGSVAFAAVFVLTRMVNVPINDQLMTWQIANPPEDYWRIWQSWERAHSVRTILAVLAFCGVSIAGGLASSSGATRFSPPTRPGTSDKAFPEP